MGTISEDILVVLIAAQAAVVLCSVKFGIVYSFFRLQDALTKGGIRPPEEAELVDLDMAEMGVLAYPEFTGVALEPVPIERTSAAPQSTPRSHKRHRRANRPAPPPTPTRLRR